MLRGPDFFIVGAPKCGTTAMTDYLGQHPQVGMCDRKETQYFAFDLYPRFGREEGAPWITRDEYLELFTAAQGADRIGETSVWYLYSSEAPRAIKEFSPEADIIVMLRNPLEALPSLHAQFVFVGIEPEEDFERALALDGERERAGLQRGFPPRSYRSAVRYSEQLRRYLDVFGRDRVHVIIYDELRADALKTYRATCEFLGVDTDFVPDVRVVNPRKRVRSRWLRGVLFHPPEQLRGIVRLATSQPQRRRITRALKRWNSRFVSRAAVPEQVTDSLRPLVAEEVAELRELLGVDLSAWLDHAAGE